VKRSSVARAAIRLRVRSRKGNNAPALADVTVVNPVKDRQTNRLGLRVRIATFQSHFDDLSYGIASNVTCRPIYLPLSLTVEAALLPAFPRFGPLFMTRKVKDCLLVWEPIFLDSTHLHLP
jgi:hypothetical protein